MVLPDFFNIFLSHPELKTDLEDIKYNKQVDEYTINLINYGIDDTSAGVIAQAFSAEKAPTKLELLLHGNEISDVGVAAIFKALEQALESKNAPQELTIDFRKNKISDIGVSAIAETLKKCGKLLPKLTLHFSTNYKIGDAGLSAMAELLESGNAPSVLHLNFSFTSISDIGIKALTKAFKNLSTKLTLNLASNKKISAQSLKYIAATLASENPPKGLTIELPHRRNDWDKDMLAAEKKDQEEAYIALAESLTTENGLENLKINPFLQEHSLEVIKAFAKVIASPKAPKGLHFIYPRLSSESFELIAKALASGEAREGVHLDFSSNEISDKEFQYFIEALKSQRLPSELTINFDGNKISDIGAKAFADALKRLGKDVPKKLSISLSHTNITDVGIADIVESITPGTTPPIEIILHPTVDKKLKENEKRFHEVVREVFFKFEVPLFLLASEMNINPYICRYLFQMLGMKEGKLEQVYPNIAKRFENGTLAPLPLALWKKDKAPDNQSDDNNQAVDLSSAENPMFGLK